MKTVKEVSKLAGVSVRTLHYYDTIGLLKPTEVTGAGYRLYDDTALERLQAILLFRELEFPLEEIKNIMDSSGFDRRKALEQQIKLLELKREHLDNLINFARGIKATGVRNLSFKAFDTSKIDEYARKTKEAEFSVIRWAGPSLLKTATSHSPSGRIIFERTKFSGTSLNFVIGR